MTVEPNGVPGLRGSRVQILEETIKWVHRRVARALPDETWIRQRFLRRTLGEVVHDGFTLANASCIDRTLVTTAILARHSVDSFIIVSNWPSGRLHLTIELEREDGSWVWADYGSNESRLFEGRFWYARVPGNVPQLARMRSPRYTPAIWDSRPPMRFLNGMGVAIAPRFDRFERSLIQRRLEWQSPVFNLRDRLVRRPEDSEYAHRWRDYKVVQLGELGVDFLDLHFMHLYLEHDERS